MKLLPTYKMCITLLLMFVYCQLVVGQIIPTPYFTTHSDGSYKLPEQCKVGVDGIGLPSAEYLIGILEKPTGYSFELVKNKIKNGILITFEGADGSLGQEGYVLELTPELVTIRANHEKGAFYAIQSLLQLFPAEIMSPTKINDVEWLINCQTIIDKPKYGWRSFMLDSGRQFQKPEFIKRYIDLMAMLKMNVFHWHLTEGQGWRIEIEKYPLLTEIGSKVAGGEEQQGYYTREDIRDIVSYAKSRHIEIVPEIDVPGHSEAALTAYPQYTCFKKAPESVMGFSPNLFCGGNENTYIFLKDILDEVCALFPFNYIHLGGDEAPKKNWDSCKACQEKIKEEGLGNSAKLQLYFSARLANYLKTKGKNAIFWGDVVYEEGYELPDNVIVQWWNWRGHKDLALKNAIKHGHQVICSTNYYCYLNFPVSPWSQYGKERTFDLETVYKANPSDLEQPNSLVIGMSANLWTDWYVKQSMIDQRVFPRIYVLAEQMWHVGEKMCYSDFYELVKSKYSRLENMGVRYGPANTREMDAGYSWEMKEEQTSH